MLPKADTPSVANATGMLLLHVCGSESAPIELSAVDSGTIIHLVTPMAVAVQQMQNGASTAFHATCSSIMLISSPSSAALSQRKSDFN